MLKTLKFFTHNNILSFQYRMQYRTLGLISLLNRQPLKKTKNHIKLLPLILKELQMALWLDAARFSNGTYPIELKSHLMSFDRLSVFKDILFDYPKVLNRRKNKNFKVKSKYPDYFSRTFHNQTGGYTTKDSAFLYDEQVETLFIGTANIMRRSLIFSMRKMFERKQSFSILEMGCGTGSSSKMVADTFKKSTIISSDLSHEYVEYAKKNNNSTNISYKEIDATQTKLRRKFDCIFHVYLLHELPLKERVMVLSEQVRLLKSGGLGFIVDSIQLGDKEGINLALEDFPKVYHEPFFKSYILFSLEKWMRENDEVELIDSEMLFFSKCITFRKK